MDRNKKFYTQLQPSPSSHVGDSHSQQVHVCFIINLSDHLREAMHPSGMITFIEAMSGD